MDFQGCSFPSNSSKIVVKENRSKFEIINNNRIDITKIQVDGCLIKDNMEKCDWIIEYEKFERKALFIELKGCDLDKAISQLKSTLEHTKHRYKEYKKECFAVTTRIPKHGAKYHRKKLDFHKTTNSTLSIKNLIISIEV